MSQASTALRGWGIFKPSTLPPLRDTVMERWTSCTSTLLLQTHKQHLPGRNPPSKHPSALYMVPSTATDRQSTLMWSRDIEMHFTAILNREELLGSRRSTLNRSSCLHTQWQGEQVPKGWRKPEQQCVKEAALCCPQTHPLSSLATSPAVYKPVSIESDSLNQTGTEDTAQEQF